MPAVSTFCATRENILSNGLAALAAVSKVIWCPLDAANSSASGSCTRHAWQPQNSLCNRHNDAQQAAGSNGTCRPLRGCNYASCQTRHNRSSMRNSLSCPLATGTALAQHALWMKRRCIHVSAARGKNSFRLVSNAWLRRHNSQAACIIRRGRHGSNKPSSEISRRACCRSARRHDGNYRHDLLLLDEDRRRRRRKLRAML